MLDRFHLIRDEPNLFDKKKDSKERKGKSLWIEDNDETKFITSRQVRRGRVGWGEFSN